MTRVVRKEHLWIATVLIAVAISLFQYLKAGVYLALNDDRYFQMIVAPFLCAFLLYWHRTRIFAKAKFSPKLGLPPLIISIGLCILMMRSHTSLSISLLGALSLLIAAFTSVFLLCFGDKSLREGLSAFACLLLMIPLPAEWMDAVSVAYQHGSAGVSFAIFKMASIPVFRQGMTFSLPGLNIEIARECSGIRSSLMFFAAGILTASLYLQSGWRRFALIAATIPISVVKNAVRIVTLSLLSMYVNRSFLDGPIHHKYGGLLSLPVDLVLFVPLLVAFRKSEADPSADISAPTEGR